MGVYWWWQWGNGVDYLSFIANPHTYIIEDGGRNQMAPEQLKFKQLVEPYKLLNSSKIKASMQELTVLNEEKRGYRILHTLLST